MQRVNRLRNDCAHTHQHRITLEDIDHIGETLQPRYQELKTAHGADLKVLTIWTLARLYEPFSAVALTAELMAKFKSEHPTLT